MIITGIEYLTHPEDSLGFLDKYLAEITDLQSNEFHEPFEFVLGMWKKKMILARENLEILLKIQKQWLEILPNVNLKIELENELYLKLERIWKRIVRMGRSYAYVSLLEYTVT